MLKSSGAETLNLVTDFETDDVHRGATQLAQKEKNPAQARDCVLIVAALAIVLHVALHLPSSFLPSRAHFGTQ